MLKRSQIYALNASIWKPCPIEEPTAVRSLVEQSTFPDSVPEFSAFFGCGLLRLLTDGNGIAFLVFAMGGSDNGP